MGFSEQKERMTKAIDDLKKEKNARIRAEALQALQVSILFEMYGELSSIAHDYKAMRKITEARELERTSVKK